MHLQFVGPMIDAANTQNLPTQGETVARLLANRGHRIELVSKHPNRYARLIDVAWTTLARSQGVDVQMLQVFSGPSFVVEDVASRAAMLTRTPIVMTLHGGDMPQFSRRFPRWARRVLGRAAMIVAPSRYLQDALGWLGFPITVIPNVINLGDYAFRLRHAARPRLLWMRTFHDVYDPEMAVRVLSRLMPFFPDAIMTMAGPDMGLLARTQALAVKLGVRDRIHFAGFLDEPAKARASMDHDIYLNTNRIDNMPVSVLEMGAMGLPVVSTSVGGIPFMLTQEVNGLLVAPSDDAAMARAVARLLRQATLVETLSRGGRRLAEHSSPECVAPQWERLLQHIAETNR